MEPRDNHQNGRDKSNTSCLTLTVFPRRPPQKGLTSLDIESTALWAAILILKQRSRARGGGVVLATFFLCQCKYLFMYLFVDW